MTNKFTTPCYIRKNTPELRRKLEDLGYKLNNGKAWGSYLATFRIKGTNEWKYVASPEWDLQNNPDIDVSIDCGENEDLFLALSALREGTDKGQWFIYDTMDCIVEAMRTIEWFICPSDNIKDFLFYDCGYLSAHKATVEELINHFNSK